MATTSQLIQGTIALYSSLCNYVTYIRDLLTHIASNLYNHTRDFLTQAASEAATNVQNQNLYSILLAVVASVPFFLYSHDIVATVDPNAIMRDLNLSSKSQVNFYFTYKSFGPMIGGALLAGLTSNYFGRRLFMRIGAGAHMIGALVVCLTTNFAASISGCVLMGVGIGMGVVIGPIFIAEMAPAPKRGFLSSIPQIMMVLGMIVVITLELCHLDWRLTVGLMAIPSGILSIILFIPNVIPDSPCWLVALGDVDDAATLIKRCGASDDEVSDRMLKIKEAIGISIDSTGNGVSYGTSRRGIHGFWKYARSYTWIRRRWYAVMGLFRTQEMASSQLLLVYLPIILANNDHGSQTQWLTLHLVLRFIQLICSVIPTLFLDSVGHRRFLLISIAGVGVLLGSFGGTFFVDDRELIGSGPVLALYAIEVVGMIGFGSIGLGIIPWIWAPEALPLQVRAPAIGISVSLKVGVSLYMGLNYRPYYTTYDKAGFGFLISSGVMVIAFVFCYLFFKDRTTKILENED